MMLGLQRFKKTWIILLLIIIAGFGLRVYDLGSKSFWIDELLSIQSSKDIVDLKTFLTASTINAHPPLYFLLLKIWSLSGDGEMYLRMLSVIFGVLTIFATYLLAKQFYAGDTPILAAFLVSVSPLLILHDREVRMYPLFVFLSTMTLLFFIKALKDNRNRDWVGFIAFCVINVYTHYHAFLLIASIWVFYLTQFRTYRHLWKKFLLSQFIIMLCFSFWLPSFYLHLKQWSILGGGFDRFPTVFGLWVKPLYLLFAFSLGQTILPWNLSLAIPGILIFLLAFFLGIKSMLKERNTLAFFLIFIFVPIFLSLFISNSMPRYMLFIVPLFYLVMGKGLAEICPAKLKYAVLVILLIILGFSLKNYYNNQEFHVLATVDPWRDVGQYLREKVKNHDQIVSIGDNLTVQYYAGLPIKDMNVDTVRQLGHLNQGAGDVWLVVSHPAFTLQAEEGTKWLNKRYNLISSKYFFYDPENVTKEKYFNKIFLKYRIKIFQFRRGKHAG